MKDNNQIVASAEIVVTCRNDCAESSAKVVSYEENASFKSADLMIRLNHLEGRLDDVDNLYSNLETRVATLNVGLSHRLQHVQRMNAVVDILHHLLKRNNHFCLVVFSVLRQFVHDLMKIVCRHLKVTDARSAIHGLKSALEESPANNDLHRTVATSASLTEAEMRFSSAVGNVVEWNNWRLGSRPPKALLQVTSLDIRLILSLIRDSSEYVDMTEFVIKLARMYLTSRHDEGDIVG